MDLDFLFEIRRIYEVLIIIVIFIVIGVFKIILKKVRVWCDIIDSI